ncbi:hypothetical protein [Cohnella sp. JJ-181]|uniref:hypothetical protein n=1 Tax=Cohnella rhizoplanae TaxID=2974897 RepID=UPI0022FF9608|nr:hypothetical protein [Cohnella sp. JJ-181]CAI6024045.1 hypothetical protein COHCIP112018_00432 [Cohnella sp. JJ-181]
MAYEEKRTDGKPVFDTDRAWERFERAAAGEPVPALWRQAETDRRSDGTGIGAVTNEAGNNEAVVNGAGTMQAGTMQASTYGKPDNTEKDGAVTMNRTHANGAPQAAPAAAAGPAPMIAGAARREETGGGRWRTEKPARRRLRRWSAGIAAAAVAAGLIATPLGDRTLAAMLDTFRIQHVVGVGLSTDDMAAISNLLERGSPDGDRSFDLAQYGTLTQSGGGEARTVTWAEADRMLGVPLLRLGSPAAPSYQPATALTFRLNVKAVNRLLTRLGSATTLPAEADGKAITLRIPDGFVMEGTLAGKPARLLQFGKPELTVEGGIDASVVREAILGLPVLPESLRTKLAAIGDWQSTLPVPARDGATESLRLGGYDAVMTEGDARRFLLWLDGDRMGLLSVATADFSAASGFRQAAEALIRP